MKWFGPKRKKNLPDCYELLAEICELSIVVKGGTCFDKNVLQI
jgi:hypothetical protein